MRVKLFMMMKNEDDLLQPWIRYHARLVGPENLIIFDNGSTSPQVRRIVEWARGVGVSIDQSRRNVDDWINQGEIYTRMVREMDRRKQADFYFFMDCDEFLAVEKDGVLSIGRDSLEAELARHATRDSPLLIRGALDNSLKLPGQFRWSDQVKNFFAADACDYIVTGFHIAKSKSAAPAHKTDVVFVHYHFKPFDTYVEHAKAKIAPWIADFSREALLDYVARQAHGHHCASIMLMSKEDYLDSFGDAGFVPRPEVAAAFAAVGEPLPFASDAVDDARRWRALAASKPSPWRPFRRLFGWAGANRRPVEP